MTTSQTPLTSRHPSLYELAEDGHTLHFFFSQCSSCDGLNFPANVPGCIHCGDALGDAARLTRPVTPTLLEYVTLHVPLVPGTEAPSIAGDIELAKGIVEEGVIAVPDEKMIMPGMSLKAVATIRDSDGTYACQFVPAELEEKQ